MVKHTCCCMHDAKGMLKARMHSFRINHIRHAELANAPKALENGLIISLSHSLRVTNP